MPCPSRPSWRSRPRPWWRSPAFVRLWIGQTSSVFAAQSALITLPLVAVLTLGASPTQLGLLRAVQQAPVLLLSLAVGAWVDRSRARRVMITADLGRAVIVLAVVVGRLTDRLDLPLFAIAAFALGSLGVLFDLAYQALVVRLVPRDHLAAANSALEAARSGTQLAGPALGGALVSLFTAPLAVITSGAGWLGSAVVLWRLRTAADVPAPEAGQGRSGVWSAIRSGVRIVWRHPALRAVGAASAAFQFALSAVTTVYLLFATRVLELSAGMVGLTLAALGPGAVVGAVLAARLPRRVGFGRVLIGAAVLADLSMLMLPLAYGPGVGTLALLISAQFVFGLGGQLVDVTVTTLRQVFTPASAQARVVATLNVIGLGFAPLGSLAGGWLAGTVGIRWALLFAAAATIISPVIIAVSPLARVGTRLPDPEAVLAAER